MLPGAWRLSAARHRLFCSIRKLRNEVIHQQERRQHAQHATLSTSEEAKHFSLRQLRRSPSPYLAMVSCLVCGCGTPLTQPQIKTAYDQRQLPRTISRLQRGAALAGRKSLSGSKRSRNEPLSVSCATSPGALSPEDQGDSPCYCCTRYLYTNTAQLDRLVCSHQ